MLINQRIHESPIFKRCGKANKHPCWEQLRSHPLLSGSIGGSFIRSVVDTVGFTIYHIIEEKLYQDIPGKWLLKKHMILPTGNCVT